MDKIEVARLFHECSRYLHHRRGKKMSQNKVLFHLFMHGDLSQKELQDFFKIQSGSMSELVLKLESNGLIKRYKDELDQRKNMLSITLEGRKVIEAIFEETKQEETELFGCLSNEECENLANILNKLIIKWNITDDDNRTRRCK